MMMYLGYSRLLDILGDADILHISKHIEVIRSVNYMLIEFLKEFVMVNAKTIRRLEEKVFNTPMMQYLNYVKPHGHASPLEFT